MIILSVNEVIRDDINEKEYRILWIDEGFVIAYLIDINAISPSPFIMSVKEILNLIKEDQMIKVYEDSFELEKVRGEIKPKDIQRRDEAWNSIRDIVSMQPEIYEKNKRGKLISLAAEKSGDSYNTILKRLRKYWIRGMTINCLLPDYENCGVKVRQYSKKPGKKRKNGIEGLVITQELKDIFKKTLEKHYLTTDSNTLVFAYKEMLRKDFYKKKYYKDGVKQILLKPEDEIPSFDQFRYFFCTEYRIDEINRARVGDKAFERDYRAILGSSTFKSFGPGSIYQIDSTPANIFIVNRANRNWTIGRPLIYFITDVFSRLITGLYIGLENDSWVAAMMGIENATTDKSEFCAKYGINITSEIWPAQNLPEKIVGDRGPLEGYSVNNLINGLNIDVDLNPAYRPDWKGIVEQLMKKSQETVRPFLPGYVDKDYGERGAKDPRTKATITLDEYIKIMIHFVNYYNHNFYIKDYIRDLDMVEDEVRPIPIELWNWGIKNRSGKLRKRPKKVIQFHLMPQDVATVTNKGIKYKKMLYTCKEGVEQGWFSKQKSWKVKFSYDPRNMNQIYIHTNDKDIFIPCFLLDHQERYIDLSMEEINQLLSEEEDLYSDVKHELLQNELNFFESIEHVVNEAKVEKNEQYDDSISDNQRKRNYRERKKEEKNYRRNNEAFNLVEDENPSTEVIQSQVVNLFKEDESNEATENLKTLFEENWGKY